MQNGVACPAKSGAWPISSAQGLHAHELSCCTGADNGLLANSRSSQVCIAARSGGLLQRFWRILPALPLRAKARLADQHGPCRCGSPGSCMGVCTGGVLQQSGTKTARVLQASVVHGRHHWHQLHARGALHAFRLLREPDWLGIYQGP